MTAMKMATDKMTMMMAAEAKAAAMGTLAAVEAFTEMSDGDGGSGKSNRKGGGGGGGS